MGQSTPKRITALVLAGVLALGLGSGRAAVSAAQGKVPSFEGAAPAESTLVVTPVESVTDSFIRGVDISSYLAERESGVQYYNYDGQSLDDVGFFRLLAQCGVNWVRIRVWNDPTDADGNPYGGGHNDLATAKTIGRLATTAGLSVMIDFHCSDFWADAEKQTAPKAWANLTFAEKEAALRDNISASLKALWSAGVDVKMVQIGNETNQGIAGEQDSARKFALLKAGCEAARTAAQEDGHSLTIALHDANPETKNFVEDCMAAVKMGVDFDVFAASYYPYRNGTTEQLAQSLKAVAKASGKQVLVAETSYPHTKANKGNAPQKDELAEKEEKFRYEISVQGQANALRDVMAAVASVGQQGLGAFYWEPAWIPARTSAEAATAAGKAELAQLEQSISASWATSYAGGYDARALAAEAALPQNQALFGLDGSPLESLRVFRYIFGGTTAENLVLRVEDVTQEVEPGTMVPLPQTVEAVRMDCSTVSVPVNWATGETALSTAETAQPGTLTLKGTAEADGSDWPLKFSVEVKAKNYIHNPGFEENNMNMWILSDETTIDRAADSSCRTGNGCLKFWNAEQVEYVASQPLTDIPAGTYTLSGWMQGGDAGENAMFQLYLSVDGTLYAANAAADGWQKWNEAKVTDIVIPEGAQVTVGVRAQAVAGAWGAWDDFALTKQP